MQHYKRIPRSTYAICSVVAVACDVSIWVLYPGLASYDSVYQWMQVQGVVPVGDWHPVAMVLLWKLLYFITGKLGSMFVLWQVLFWGAVALLLIVSLRRSRRILPLLVLGAVMLSPLVQPIVGTIWKDSQLAIALLGATALLWHTTTSARFTGVTKVAVVALLVYAGLIRHNALVAVVPLLYIWAAAGWPRVHWRYHAAAVVGVLVGMLAVSSCLAMMATKQHPIVSVMVDDIVGVTNSTSATVKQADLQPQFMRIAAACRAKNVRANVFFRCMDDADRHAFTAVHHAAIKTMWLKTITTHPFAYVQYRAGVYGEFLTGGLSEKELNVPDVVKRQYVASPNIVAVAADGTYIEQPHHSPIAQGLVSYSHWFAYGVLAFLFRPWFWLLVAGVLLLQSLRRANKTAEVQLAAALAVSTLLYIASYVPVAVATDYRYILWPVMAVCVGYALLLVHRLRTTSV